VADVNPGDGNAERLKRYWATGEGRQKWVNSPHPFTTLRDLLRRYVSARVADGLAANIFHMALGYWPGERGGLNKTGPG
jgi:hypothetical protein